VADRHVGVLLAGGGMAAANCARWLREEGFDGSVLLVAREPHPPYNRPPCSKGYLQGKETLQDTLFRPDEWWEEQSIELQTRTSVLKLDLEDRVAVLSTQEEVSFDKALVATGSNVRLLRVEGVGLEGIHYLRALGNADTIRSDTEGVEHVVVVGGSYIGTEVAASLTLLGRSVTILMQEDVTHERSFGAQAGRYFQSVLEEHGIEVVGGDGLARFEGDGERVTKVVTERGRELPAGAVVIGAGAVPDTMLAKQAGLELGDRGGVRCDSRLQTSRDGIYAAGDICEYESAMHGGPVRIEHWDVAFNHGKTAALNILGRDVPHEVVPYFYSDLADWCSLEYVGPAYEWEEEVVRGSLEEGEFSIWYLGGGRVKAALSVDRSDDLEHARRLIAAGTEVEDRADVLADLSFDLADL
jgi:3-phenylpropionate/trans-cinnamate dioxygenase ferredoxin reductase component